MAIEDKQCGRAKFVGFEGRDVPCVIRVLKTVRLMLVEVFMVTVNAYCEF